LPSTQLKILEVKTGGDGAAHKGIRSSRPDRSAKPMAGRDDSLRDLARIKIRTKVCFNILTGRADYKKRDRAPLVEMPDLVRFQAMEIRHFIPGQQIINGC